MPTDQPNTATDVPADAREDATAAAVLHDEQPDDAPGGGGPGGTSPNAPVDTGVSGGDAAASAEAQVLATENEAEAHPS